MRKFANRFLKDESAAVTVDWVIVTAALTMFGVAIVLLLRTEAVGVGERTSTELASIEVR